MFTLISTLTLALAMPANAALAPPAAFQQEGGAKVDESANSSAELERKARVNIQAAKVLGSELGLSAQAAGMAREAAAQVLDLVLRGDAPADARALYESALGLWVEQLVIQGKQEEARAMLEGVIGEAAAEKLAPGGKAFLASLGADSELRRTLAELNRSEGKSKLALDASQQDMDRQVAAAAASGRTDFVLQIGKGAAQGLLAVLAAEADPYYEAVKTDPMYMLFKVNPLAGESYVKGVLEGGERSLFWNLRFSKALRDSGILYQNELWESQTMQNDVCRAPSILSVCDELLLEPALARAIAAGLRSVATHRAMTPAMLRYIKTGMRGRGILNQMVYNWLYDAAPMPSLRPALLIGLASQERDIWQKAAVALMRLPSNARVYELILAGGEGLRETGAEWLDARRVDVLNGTAREVDWWTPPAGIAEDRFLDSLLQDESAAVRKETLRIYQNFRREEYFETNPGWPEHGVGKTTIKRKKVVYSLAPSTVRKLAMDPDKEVRERLMQIAYLLPKDQLEELILAGIHDADLIAAERALRGAAHLDWIGQPQASLEVLKQALADAPPSDGQRRHSIQQAMAKLSSTPAGLEIAARWAIDSSDADVLDGLLGFSELRRVRDQIVALPASLWTEVLVLASGEKGKVVKSMLAQPLRADQLDAAEARVLSDPDLNHAQLQALVACMAAGNRSGNVESLVLLFKAAGGALGAERSSYFSVFVFKGTSFTMGRAPVNPEVVAQAFLVVIGDERMSWEAIDNMYRLHGNLLTITQPIAELVRRRSSSPEPMSGLVRDVLRWMGSHPEHADRDWIAELAGHPGFAGAAFQAISELKDPALLPVVAKVIAGSAASYDLSAAVRSLTGFMSDESAELLLIAARKTANERLRDFCLAEVDKISALQDAEERWATRRIAQATRATTVSKLLGLLSSSDDKVRIQAIRGLATWEAVEALPELIPLIANKNAALAKAAQTALDAINKRP